MFSAPSARFDNSRALSNDELRRYAPSIFATEGHHSRSDKFRPIPTIEVIEAMRNDGFFPVSVKQQRTRDVTKREYTKHALRFRRFDRAEEYKVGDTTAELVMLNANDGTSPYKLMSGLFRLACLNGMITCVGDVDSVRVMHKGKDVPAQVVEGSYRVMENSKLALAAPAEWSQIKMSREAAHVLAEQVHAIRFADSEGKVSTPIQPAQLLIPRRQADREPNLWIVNNVIQENIIRGGLSAIGTGSNGRQRQFTTKNVNGIAQDVRLNQALFALSSKMAEILKPAA